MQPDTAFLTALNLDDGRVIINSYCNDADCDCAQNFAIIGAGETFGGRTFAEWQAIANGSGRITASWLEV